MTPDQKDQRYLQAREEILAVVAGETNVTAKMASVASLLAQAFPHFYWTGFYNVDPQKKDELVVGPYQGTLGCLRIPFGKGVCGTAAVQRKTQIVEDVHAFANHIACDPKSSSEIVVPVFGAGGELIAVLDVDAAEKGAFDPTDAKHLEALMAAVFSA
jgi:L-methionine (R)-S-oxide reductase